MTILLLNIKKNASKGTYLMVTKKSQKIYLCILYGKNNRLVHAYDYVTYCTIAFDFYISQNLIGLKQFGWIGINEFK